MVIGNHLSDVKTLWGSVACAETTKCLFTAAEKGVDIDAKSIHDPAEASAFMQHSPFGIEPCLKDLDFVIYGSSSIMSFLDDKGFGTALVPRNGITRSQQYKWIHLAKDILAPAIIVVCDHSNDNCDSSVQTIETVLAYAEEQLSAQTKKSTYLVGDFSLADIHWIAHIHLLLIHGHTNLISNKPSLDRWLSKIMSRKSTSKENFTSSDVLPSLNDINSDHIHSVHINA